MKRTDLDLRIDDCWHRAAFATTPESKQLWQQRYEALVQERKAKT